MKVRVVKDVNVDDDAVAKIAEDFLEWLDERGYELTVKDSYKGLVLEDESYEDLAKIWVADVKDKDYD